MRGRGQSGPEIEEAAGGSDTRLDKWLWAARFFKTRALASRACELGRIESNGQQAKASREVKAGVPMRMPDGSIGFRWSNGIMFLFTVIPAASSACSACLPALP